jgi:ABC-2 type transport system permease protein
VSLRNPYILFVFLAPLLYAAIFQFILGLWKLQPGVAIYDYGDKTVVRELKRNKAIRLTEMDSAEGVYKIVEDKKVDVGIVFPKDTKELLAEKRKITLKIFVSGDSLAKNRAIAGAAIIDALRKVSPEPPPITFKQVRLGEERGLTLLEMLIPLFTLVVIMLGSYMLPASFIVNEKEKKTLSALLVSPATPLEILLAFGIVGVIISLLMGMLLLLLTVGIAQPLLLLTIFFLGTVLGAEWGIMLGVFSKDQTALIANIKGLNLFLIAPAVIIMFPDWPQWIAKIFPTYYIANPIFRISIYGEGWSEIGWQVLVLVGLAVLFFFPVVFSVNKLIKAS